MRDKEKVIIKDFREEIYPIMASRMDSMLNNYTEREYYKCYYEINNMKMILAPEMDEKQKIVFDQASEKLRDLILMSQIKPTDQASRTKVGEAAAQVPFLLEFYIEMVFKEMSRQGIWFPKGVKFDSFDTRFMEETFGIDSSMQTEKLKAIRELSKDELIEFLTTSQVEDIHARMIMKNVLQT
jgi:hypothetical protein